MPKTHTNHHKIATCCYCGTRAALVLDEVRHELACSSCGAPLHEMKHLRTQDLSSSKSDKKAKKAAKKAAKQAEKARKAYGYGTQPMSQWQGSGSAGGLTRSLTRQTKNHLQRKATRKLVKGLIDLID